MDCFQKLMRDADEFCSAGRPLSIPQLDTSVFDLAAASYSNSGKSYIVYDASDLDLLRSSVRRIKPNECARKSSMRDTKAVPPQAFVNITSANILTSSNQIGGAWEAEVNACMVASDDDVDVVSEHDSDDADDMNEHTSGRMQQKRKQIDSKNILRKTNNTQYSFRGPKLFGQDIVPVHCFGDQSDDEEADDPLDRLIEPSNDQHSSSDEDFGRTDLDSDENLQYLDLMGLVKSKSPPHSALASTKEGRKESVSTTDHHHEPKVKFGAIPSSTSTMQPDIKTVPNPVSALDTNFASSAKPSISLEPSHEQKMKEKIQRIRRAGLGFDAAASIEHGVLAKRPRDNNVPQHFRRRAKSLISSLSHAAVAAAHKNTKPDLAEIELKYFHRPRMIRDRDRPWNIVFNAKQGDSKPSTSSSNKPLHQAATGALSRVLHTEADKQNLSLAHNSHKFVVLEYVEEFPPVQLNFGMASALLNYYRSAEEDEDERRQKARVSTDELLQSLTTGSGGATGVRCRLPRHLMLLLQQRNVKQPYECDASAPRLQLGDTKVLALTDESPFLGELDKEEIQPAFENNLFRAPVFRHRPHRTDFLLVRTKMHSKLFQYCLREIPYLYLAGQLEPQRVVPRPIQRITSLQEKFYSLFAVRYLQTRADEGAEFEDVQRTLLRYCLKDDVAPHKFQHRSKLRSVLRLFAEEVRDSLTGDVRWFLKDFEKAVADPQQAYELERRYSSEELAKSFSPEDVCLQESCNAAEYRLFQQHISDADLGRVETWLNRTHKLKQFKMERAERVKRHWNEHLADEGLSASLERLFKVLTKEIQRLEGKMAVARFVFDRLVTAPWNITEAFVRSQLERDGQGRIELMGKGDPSGRGEAFSFVRIVRPPEPGIPNTSAKNKNKNPVKLFDTDKDLRKLTKEDAVKLLVALGVRPVEARALKRWDRVHMIREMSTKLERSGLAKELHKYARGDGFKAASGGGGGSDEVFRSTCQDIWYRQKAALGSTLMANLTRKRVAKLATDTASVAVGDDPSVPTETRDGAQCESMNAVTSMAGHDPAAVDAEVDDSTDDSDSDDDIERALAARAAVNLGAIGPTADNDATKVQDHDDENDIEEEKEELRAFGDLFGSNGTSSNAAITARKPDTSTHRKLNMRITGGNDAHTSTDSNAESAVAGSSFTGDAATGSNSYANFAARPGWVQPAKVVKRVIKVIGMDGVESLRVEFVLQQSEVRRVEWQVEQDRRRREQRRNGAMLMAPESTADDFVDQPAADERGGGGKSSGGADGKTTSANSMSIKLGKMKKMVDQKQAKRDALAQAAPASSRFNDVLVAPPPKPHKRGGAMSSVNLRLPRVAFAARLEKELMQLWGSKLAVYFQHRVDASSVPGYYDRVKNPICLLDMREKIAAYQYETAEALMQDMRLLASNAELFNGPDSHVTTAAKKLLDKLRINLQHERNHLGLDKDTIHLLEEAMKKLRGRKSLPALSNYAPLQNNTSSSSHAAASTKFESLSRSQQQAHSSSSRAPATSSSGGRAEPTQDLGDDGMWLYGEDAMLLDPTEFQEGEF